MAAEGIAGALDAGGELAAPAESGTDLAVDESAR
jgi:hypothetical protein